MEVVRGADRAGRRPPTRGADGEAVARNRPQTTGIGVWPAVQWLPVNRGYPSDLVVRDSGRGVDLHELTTPSSRREPRFELLRTAPSHGPSHSEGVGASLPPLFLSRTAVTTSKEIPDAARRLEAELAVQLLRPVGGLGAEEEGEVVAGAARRSERPPPRPSRAHPAAETLQRHHALNLARSPVREQLAIAADVAVGTGGEVTDVDRAAPAVLGGDELGTSSSSVIWGSPACLRPREAPARLGRPPRPVTFHVGVEPPCAASTAALPPSSRAGELGSQPRKPSSSPTEILRCARPAASKIGSISATSSEPMRRCPDRRKSG